MTVPMRAMASCFNRRSIAAAFVEHVGRERGQPVFGRRIVGRAHRTSSKSATTGIWGWRTVHTPRPFGSVDLSIAGKRNGPGGQERAAAIG